MFKNFGGPGSGRYPAGSGAGKDDGKNSLGKANLKGSIPGSVAWNKERISKLSTEELERELKANQVKGIKSSDIEKELVGRQQFLKDYLDEASKDTKPSKISKANKNAYPLHGRLIDLSEFKNFGGPGSGRYPAGSGERNPGQVGKDKTTGAANNDVMGRGAEVRTKAGAKLIKDKIARVRKLEKESDRIMTVKRDATVKEQKTVIRNDSEVQALIDELAALGVKEPKKGFTEFKNFGGPGSGRYPAGSGDKENNPAMKREEFKNEERIVGKPEKYVTTKAGAKVIQTKNKEGFVIREERAPITKAFPGHKFTVRLDGKDVAIRNLTKGTDRNEGFYIVEKESKYNERIPIDKIRDIREVKHV